MFDFDVRSGSVPPSAVAATAELGRMTVLRDAFAEPVTRVPRRPPLVVSPSFPLRATLRAMAERQATSALVVGHGILIGMVHEQELARRVLEGPAIAEDATVMSAMTSASVSLLESDAVAYAVTKLWTLNARPIPIVNPGGSLVGLIELRDIAAWLCEVAGMEGRDEDANHGEKINNFNHIIISEGKAARAAFP